MTSSGKHKPRGKVTLANIAEHCGVSKWTAAQALRGNVLVNEKTRIRIVAAAQELGYDPLRNEAARRMALQKNGSRAQNHCIGLVAPPGLAHTVYFGRILDGITRVVTEHAYGLHIITPVKVDAPLPRVCTTGEIDGLIFAFTSGWYYMLAERLRAEPNFADRPIVGLIDPIANASSVHANDFQAAYLAASHLLELGHRHVMHSFDTTVQDKLGLKESPDNVHISRVRGINQAYEDFGLDAGEYAHLVDVPRNDEEVEEKGPPFIQVLRDHPEITAIIAPNDYASIRMWKVMRRAGLRIPEDISVVSFDDTDPIIGNEGENVLTTARLPLYEIGQEGTRLMLRCIDGQISGVQNIVLPVELIVRGSTAPPKVR